MMKIETFHEKLSEHEGKFFVRIGGDQPWAEKMQFPYDNETDMDFAAAQTRALDAYDGAKKMFEVMKAQMSLSCSDAGIRHAKHD